MDLKELDFQLQSRLYNIYEEQMLYWRKYATKYYHFSWLLVKSYLQFLSCVLISNHAILPNKLLK